MFFLASLIYIGPIFFLAGSPVVSKLAAFNPWSLLHIPLYFIMTMLLLLSFLPIPPLSLRLWTPSSVASSLNPKPETYRPDRPNRPLPMGFRLSPFAYHPFFGGLPPTIAVVVAIADEAHQSLFPTRSASLGDVFLDLVGIALAVFLASYKMTRKCTPSGRPAGNGSRAPA
jgi:VanZ family protein